MKALSLWQPWASLWVSDRKIHETRHWPTPHRGPLLVHAAKKFIKKIDPGEPLRTILDDEFGGHWAMDLPTGALIGVVDIVACHRAAWLQWAIEPPDDYWCGDFAPGRFAWQRGRYHAFKRPIPWRAMQGLFDVPDGVVAPEIAAIRDATA